MGRQGIRTMFDWYRKIQRILMNLLIKVEQKAWLSFQWTRLSKPLLLYRTQRFWPLHLPVNRLMRGTLHKSLLAPRSNLLSECNGFIWKIASFIKGRTSLFTFFAGLQSSDTKLGAPSFNTATNTDNREDAARKMCILSMLLSTLYSVVTKSLV